MIRSNSSHPTSKRSTKRAALRTKSAVESLEVRTLFAAPTGALYATYFDNADFTNASFTRNDPGVHFDWQDRAPLMRMGTTTFSARWIGQVRTTTAGVYTFNVDTDGAATLRVRGSVVTLTADATGTGRSGTIELPEGQVVDLSLEYSHGTGSARMNLDWTLPGASSQTAIPTGLLVNSFGSPANTLSNPIIGSGADPWVVQWHDEYIYVWSIGRKILASRSPRLQDIGTTNGTTIYTAPSNAAGNHSTALWAPELHRLDGKWYLYFAATNNDNNSNHRMFVASRATDDPIGTFAESTVAKVAATTDKWAIDGTVLEYNSERFFIWSGWPGDTDGQQNLYIAKMSSPTTITGERALIATPSQAWERHGLPINEGPQILQRNGETHLIFSGSGYWTNEYALGDIKLTGTNPMLMSAWTKKSTPVFSQANGIAGVGHGSFVKSPDGTQDWLVYHAHKDAAVFDEDRVVRAQPFTLIGGTPVFGSPIANGTLLTEPSGTPTLLAASGALLAAQKTSLFADEEPISLIDRVLTPSVAVKSATVVTKSAAPAARAGRV